MPACVLVHAAKHGEHRVVGEPGVILGRKLLKSGTLLVRGTIEEVGRGLFHQRKLFRRRADKVRRPVMALQARDALPGDPHLLRQHLKRDEHRIACKG